MAAVISAENINEVCPVETKELCPVETKELLEECDNMWKELEEYQSKIMLLGIETMLQPDTTLDLLILQWKALAADYQQWHKRSPEVISANPDVVLELGIEELQKVKRDLEMALSAVWSKNKQLEEDLKREQQWYEEQKGMINTLNRIEEETKPQAERLTKTRGLVDLHNKVLQLKTYKKDLLSALSKFLEKHYPPLENGENKLQLMNPELLVKNFGFAYFSADPDVKLLALQDIVEILINKLMATPHEPYITIDDSFWPPYIELLLRFGIALRHPEDPNRIRLEAFHK